MTPYPITYLSWNSAIIPEKRTRIKWSRILSPYSSLVVALVVTSGLLHLIHNIGSPRRYAPRDDAGIW